MMPDDEINNSIERIVDGQATQFDIEAVRHLIDSGKAAIATGERSISIGGNASGSVIVTGDNNRVIEEANTSVMRALLRDDPGNVVQVGKYNVNIKDGREITIGDRLYQDEDAKTIQQIIRNILIDIQQGATAEAVQSSINNAPNQLITPDLIRLSVRAALTDEIQSWQKIISSPSSSKVSILVLAASPVGEARLRLDKEVREISQVLRLAKKGHNFVLEQRWAVRPDDLQDALLDIEPSIVHFCGHGTGSGGLALESEDGKTPLVSTTALANLFKLLNKHVNCVVLNACYSELQADAIHQYINHVVGMTQEIGDTAAINFSKGFYRALANDRSFEDAYEFGCNAIDLQGIPEYLTPVLKTKNSY
jgi:Effector-associated domain 10/CHAT domain